MLSEKVIKFIILFSPTLREIFNILTLSKIKIKGYEIFKYLYNHHPFNFLSKIITSMVDYIVLLCISFSIIYTARNSDNYKLPVFKAVTVLFLSFILPNLFIYDLYNIKLVNLDSFTKIIIGVFIIISIISAEYFIDTYLENKLEHEHSQ